jgi:hypothetical protein
MGVTGVRNSKGHLGLLSFQKDGPSFAGEARLGVGTDMTPRVFAHSDGWIGVLNTLADKELPSAKFHVGSITRSRRMSGRATVREKYSTSTVNEERYLVPWLASAGPLAYTPERPPSEDYFFQYGWILPQIFHSETSLRRHYYFGALYKDEARFLFRFWDRARGGQVSLRFCELEVISPDELKVPIAVYDHSHWAHSRQGLLSIQHGSYQWVEHRGQPHIDTGQVLLYRGVEHSSVFRCLRFEAERLSPLDLEVWRKYLNLQAQMLSDSVLSFNTIHDRTKRCETGHLRDGAWLSDDLAIQAGLAIRSPGFANKLWAATHQSYSLEPGVAEHKVGPHYAVARKGLAYVFARMWDSGHHVATRR